MKILSNLQVYLEDEIINKASVVIDNGLIHAIETKKHPSPESINFPANFHLVPGFIDLHVHGADGSDVMDATSEAFSKISSALAREGTTGFLATTMTDTSAHIEKTLCAASHFIQQQKTSGAQMLGVHLEGPFLAEKKVGAQRADELLPLEIKYIDHWQKISNNIIKLVTLAPELENSVEFIKQLKKNNIIAAIGHTDATYAQTLAAIDAGCTHATHLFNAMRGLHQREPGAVTAALLSDRVMAELIVDGVHLHPAIVELALKLKTKNGIALVTDSMRAKCLQDGVYDLGGQSVEVKNNIARLHDGTLAGSTLKMSSAIQNVMKFTGCSLAAAIKMAAENPAKSLGIYDKKGSIAIGKDADFAILDDEFNLVMTICRGEIVYSSLTSS